MELLSPNSRASASPSRARTTARVRSPRSASRYPRFCSARAMSALSPNSRAIVSPSRVCDAAWVKSPWTSAIWPSVNRAVAMRDLSPCSRASARPSEYMLQLLPGYPPVACFVPACEAGRPAPICCPVCAKASRSHSAKDALLRDHPAGAQALLKHPERWQVLFYSPTYGRSLYSLPARDVLPRRQLDNRRDSPRHRVLLLAPLLDPQPVPALAPFQPSAALRSNSHAGTRTTTTLRRSAMQALPLHAQ